MTQRYTGGSQGWVLWFTTLVLPLVPPQKFPLLEGSRVLMCVKALWDRNQRNCGSDRETPLCRHSVYFYHIHPSE